MKIQRFRRYHRKNSQNPLALKNLQIQCLVDVIVIIVNNGLIKISLTKNNVMAKKEFPEVKEKNKGKFTAWAKKNGFKDACSAASAVMKNKKKYKPAVIKMANYAKNFGCSTKK